MKRILAMLLTGLMLLSGLQGFATVPNGDDGIMPLWLHVSAISGDVTFNSKTDEGIVKIKVIGNPDVTKISATATLYYQNERGRWVKTSTAWNYSVNSDELAINETFAAESGKTYRVLLSASVYVGDTKEAVLEEFIGKY